MLFNLLKLVDKSGLSFQEKFVYGNLLRAQLGEGELYFISAAGISEGASEEFREYMIRFRILKHIRNLEFLDIVKKFYPDEMFKSRD